jgi:hypothetical protein
MTDTPPAGWYADPEDPSQQRYWDGSTWTEHRAPAAQPAQPSYAVAPQGSWGPQSETSGGAIAALVLGILSIVACFGPITGIPAMIVGRRASRDIEASGGRLEGGGLATGGFVTGLIGTLLGVLVIIGIIGLVSLSSSNDY